MLALGLGSLLAVAAAVMPVMAVVLVLADTGLLLAAWWDFRQAAATPLGARRSWPPLLVQGAPSEVGVEIHNPSARPVSVACREGLHPALADAPMSWTVELLPLAQATRRYTVLPGRRGTHRMLPLTVRVQGPWGLAWAQRDLLPAQECRVYPQVRWQGQVGMLLALAQRHELGSVPIGFAGRGGESYGLREYRAGDPLGTIHWKATARHGRLVSRELTWERGARLVILLDCARAMTAIDGGRSKLDHALAAALALARVASGRGDHVRVAAFSNRVLRVVKITPGGGGVREAYRSLFDLEAELVEPSFDLAAELALRSEGRQATVVLFSSVVDLGAAEVLQEALVRLETRHRPLLVNLEDPELQALAHCLPAGVPEAFAKVTALGIVAANRQLSRRLRRHGVRVLSVPADRLALDAIEAYLGMFAMKTGSRLQVRRPPGEAQGYRLKAQGPPPGEAQGFRLKAQDPPPTHTKEGPLHGRVGEP